MKQPAGKRSPLFFNVLLFPCGLDASMSLDCYRRRDTNSYIVIAHARNENERLGDSEEKRIIQW
jgi:hypothetical protein